MGKHKVLKHEANKFEAHLEQVNNRKIKKVVTQKQQQKRAIQETAIAQKKNLFALDSDDELNKVQLTHNGQALQDDYNDMEILSSEDDLPKGFVKNNHFVGFGGKDNTRSKKEVYQDIIANSKQKKAEKQRKKEENITKIESLNNVLPTIFEVLPLKQRHNNNNDEAYGLLMQDFKSQPRVVVEQTIHQSEKQQQKQLKQKRYEERKQRKEVQKQQAAQSSDEDEVQNDDFVSKQINSNKEKQMLKSYKKVEHLQKVMEHFKYVQDRKKVKLSKTQENQDDEDENENEIDDDQALEDLNSDEEYEDSEDEENEENEGEDQEDEEEGEDEDEDEEDEGEVDNDDLNSEENQNSKNQQDSQQENSHSEHLEGKQEIDQRSNHSQGLQKNQNDCKIDQSVEN